MHIVHVITSLYPGGAQSALLRLCLHDSGNRHTVITMIGGGELEEELSSKGVNVENLGFSYSSGLLTGMARLWKLLRKYKPDLVQTWMYHPDLIGGICARLAGVRHVCWGIRHTRLEHGNSSRSSILSAKFCAILSGFVPARIVCCAHESMRIHELLGYRLDKMTVIPNGYDLAAFYPYPHEKQGALSGIPETADDLPVLGMVGRYNPQKDHLSLLKALAELRNRNIDFLCLLVGEDLDSNNETLSHAISELGLGSHVLMLGLRTDIPAIMNRLDLHILSSSFGEAFPNVVAEAMACGTPCVATDVGDTALIIGGHGWIVPPRNHLLLADAIQSAIDEYYNTPVLWTMRQHSCAEHIKQNFTIDKMVSSFGSVWSECLAAKE
ncbi:glycosyltransferase [Halomonas sp. BM-2019]|uniref:glycosyltransferase n=1 Tax=Halomonas sp. BM-2019 TaxID=2811227 RepID=UPI001B3C1C56|nr:MAG: glycosyltransferase [Halomonas sp. BM-2019]